MFLAKICGFNIFMFLFNVIVWSDLADIGFGTNRGKNPQGNNFLGFLGLEGSTAIVISCLS